jgi:hypothetical protein
MGAQDPVQQISTDSSEITGKFLLEIPRELTNFVDDRRAGAHMN